MLNNCNDEILTIDRNSLALSRATRKHQLTEAGSRTLSRGHGLPQDLYDHHGGVSYKEQAEFKELRKVASLPDPDDTTVFDFDDLWRFLDPEMDMTRDEFWESILGEEAHAWSSAFQVGFIRGAKTVWEEVGDQI